MTEACTRCGRGRSYYLHLDNGVSPGAHPFEVPLPGLFDEAPGRTRALDHPTSLAGARSIAYRAGSQKARLMAAYEQAGVDGLTDEEAAVRASLPVQSCWWKRCNELREAGAITQTGAERPGMAGVPRMVCRAVTA